VENGSGDGTLDLVRGFLERSRDRAVETAATSSQSRPSSTARPGTCRKGHVIANEENRGFPAACNQGIEWALQDGADYVILLNQDAYVQPGWLDALVSAAEESPD